MKNLPFRKSRIYPFIIIFLVVTLFSVAAVCNMCAAETETSDTTTGDETTTTISDTATTSTSTTGGTTTTGTAPATTSGEPEAPRIVELNIYMGPEYQEESGFCFYRIEAIVTGNPASEVVFSKDDSDGAWGDNRCQINLVDPADTYTLTATATNTEGEDEASIDLSWGCDEEAAPEDTLEFSTPDPEIGLDFNTEILHPTDIGYIVYPSGINTDSAIIGDSISNTDVRGFFAFDLSSIAGYELSSFNLQLKTSVPWNNPSFKGGIKLYKRAWLPSLSSTDYEIGGTFIKRWPDSDNVEFFTTVELDYIEMLAATSQKLQFMLLYELYLSDDDNKIDGREYTRDSITLTIVYLE